MKKIWLIAGAIALILAIIVATFGLLYFIPGRQTGTMTENSTETIDSSSKDAPDVKELTDADFAIVGVKIGDMQTDRDVKAKLGEPANIKPAEYNGLAYEFWEYPGLTVTLMVVSDSEKFLDAVAVTDSKYPTYRGIKVGDSLQTLQGKYGKIEGFDNSYCYEEPFVRSIRFDLSNDKVKTITISQLREATGE